MVNMENHKKASFHESPCPITSRSSGISLPAMDEIFFYFSESSITADFMVHTLEHLWPKLKAKYNPHTLVLNMDNGPENNSRRRQFMKRIVEFSQDRSVNISMAYYLPYHSKYNPIERIWGRLENHWNGELLDSVQKALGLSRTMMWKGYSPVVNFFTKSYCKGVKLKKATMKRIEDSIHRIEGIEKWAVDILCYNE